jgi:hypothetical protein
MKTRQTAELPRAPTRRREPRISGCNRFPKCPYARLSIKKF